MKKSTHPSSPSGVHSLAKLFLAGVSVLAGLNLYFAAGFQSEDKRSSVKQETASSIWRSLKDMVAKSEEKVESLGASAASSLHLGLKLNGATATDAKNQARPAPAKPKRRPLPRETVERCLQLPDESELCFYDGPFCWDGESMVVFTENPIGVDPRSSMCYDFRHYEPSYTCAYGDGFGRPPLPEGTAASVIQDTVPTLSAYGSRPNNWGPNGKEVRYREESPSLLTRSGLRARNTSILWMRPGLLGGPSFVDGVPSAGGYPVNWTSPSSWVGPNAPRAAWVEDDEDADVLPDEGDETSGLYITGFHHSWLDHTWHGAAALMQLWDLKRYNRTTSSSLSGAGAAAWAKGKAAGAAGSGSSSGNARPWDSDFAGLKPGGGQPIRPMGAWTAPPMDHVLFAGKYRNIEGGVTNLMRWTVGLLRILTSSHTHLVFNEDWNRQQVASNRLLCARRGGVLGYKPRMFNTVGDAYSFRLAAYAAARLPGPQPPPKSTWAPRRITLVTRASSRAIANLDQLLPVIKSFGVPIKWITNMGGLTYEQQVEAMANSGILIATHGAALANAIYMPAHAVLIELFPYVMYGSMYRDLAAATGLFYYSVRSQRPTKDQAYILHEDAFLKTCDGAVTAVEQRHNGTGHNHLSEKERAANLAAAEAFEASPPPGVRHVSSSGAFLDFECNWRSKSSSLIIDPAELAMVMRQAVDDIGCRDGWCDVGDGKYQRFKGEVERT